MNNKDRDLQRTEYALKQAYRELRRRVDPGYEILGDSVSHPAWGQAARTVVALKASPREYMMAQFMDCTAKVPFINVIGSPQAAQLYTELNRGGPIGIRVFERQLSRLMGMVKDLNINPDTILNDPLMNFTAVFRVMIVSDEAFPRVFERWGDAARKQLDFDDSLLSYLKERYDRASIFRPELAVTTCGTPVTVGPVSATFKSRNNYSE